MKIKVGIIGAGPAGLCAARHVARYSQKLEPIVFEQNYRIGGTWVYTDDRGKDQYGVPIHSSMYKNMITNFPKEIMSFPDFAFPEEGPSFVHHEKVLSYLQNYAEHHDLLNYIKFRNIVVKAAPLEQCEGWTLTSKNVITEEEEQYTVSYLMICNGHYSAPYIPGIPGLKNFKGKVIHSHDYREAVKFLGETVICLGAGPSGQDIALELSETAKHVYLSHNKSSLTTALPENCTEIQGIKEVSEEGLVLSNGDIINADALILCTGYSIIFPFLPDGFVNVHKNRVSPLYKHLIHCDKPTVCFVGIPFYIIPFSFFDVQVQFFLAYILGKMRLPTREEMLEDEQRDLDERLSSGLSERYAHKMGDRQWTYMDELCRLSNFKSLPLVIEKLFKAVDEARLTDLVNYKSFNYRILGEDSFVRV